MREKRDMERGVGTGHGSARSRARASPVQPATAEVCGLPRGSGLSLWSAALCRSVSSLTCHMRSSSPARRVGNTQAHSQMAPPSPAVPSHGELGGPCPHRGDTLPPWGALACPLQPTGPFWEMESRSPQGGATQPLDPEATAKIRGDGPTSCFLPGV